MLLEQIQSTAALLLVYTAIILWAYEAGDMGNPVLFFIAWIFFYTLATSAAVFFATTLMRIWM